MRMRTATTSPFLAVRDSVLTQIRNPNLEIRNKFKIPMFKISKPAPFRISNFEFVSDFESRIWNLPAFLAFLLPLLRTLLRRLAVSGADLLLGHHGAGLEHAGFAEARDHLDALPQAHLRRLPHARADLLEPLEERLDPVGLDAAAGGDTATPADIDDIRIAPLRLRHRVDHALDALDRDFRVLALWDHVAHAGHGGHDVLHRPHLLHLLELLAEIVEREVALGELGLLLLDLLLIELRLDLSDLLDDSHQVALAEDALGHALGLELVEIVEL